MSQQPDILQTLLNSTGGGDEVFGSGIEAADYDWTSPAYLTPKQIDRLKEFVTEAAKEVTNALKEFLRIDLSLTAGEPTHYFSQTLQAEEVEADLFSVALVDDKGTLLGFIALAGQSVNEWMAKLLGGSQIDLTDGTELSPVEQALLIDLFSVVNQSFWKAAPQAFRPKLTLEKSITQGKAPLDPEFLGTYCRMDLKLAEGDAKPVASLVLASDLIEAVATGKGQAELRQHRPGDKAHILGHVDNIMLRAVVSLGTAQATMRDLISLQAGDVLVINKLVDEAVELQIAGETIFLGSAVQSEGRCAIQITTPVAAKLTAINTN
jgi:flagellar motor switch protein FliM